MAQTYVSQAGDTISAIASKYGVPIANVSGYRSGDPNKLGIGENLSINVPALPPANTAAATDLNAKPLTPPPASTSSSTTAPAGLLGLIAATQKNIEEQQKTVTQGQTAITDAYTKLAGKGAERTALYESSGVNTAQKELNDINNQIRAKELSYRRQAEAIVGNNPSGRLEAGQTIALNDLDRKKASELADLAIVAEAKQGNYTVAKSIADQKIDSQTSDLQTKLEGLKLFYQQNYSQLSDSQKILLEEKTAQVTQDLADKKDLLTAVSNVQLEAAKNGAPAAVITAIGQSKDASAAVTAAGKYIGLYDRMNTISAINSRNIQNANGGFTNSQMNNGSAVAGVDAATFNSYDPQTKNLFINGNISGAKSSIDAAFKGGASPDDVKQTISDMQGLTPTVQAYLNNYANIQAKQYAPPTPEELTSTLTGTIGGLQTQGYTKGEAETAVRNELTDSGKTALPSAYGKAINDALDKTYGKTGFWNWITGQSGKK